MQGMVFAARKLRYPVLRICTQMVQLPSYKGPRAQRPYLLWLSGPDSLASYLEPLGVAFLKDQMNHKIEAINYNSNMLHGPYAHIWCRVAVSIDPPPWFGPPNPKP